MKIIIETDDIASKPDDFFLQFQLVCVTDADLDTLVRISLIMPHRLFSLQDNMLLLFLETH